VNRGRTEAFFGDPIEVADKAIFDSLSRERVRQNQAIELIAPKNYMSRAARQAMSSIISFTSVEGYPGKRYHAGVANIDEVEQMAIDRAKIAFRCAYANVQPNSGTQANQAVFFALLEQGDAVLSMDLKAGGHLSHGLKTNMSGRWYEIHNYAVRDEDGLIDCDQARALCRTTRPRMIIVGGSSYPRAIDFAAFRQMADEVGAFLVADIAHFSGLVAAGVYPDPFPHCHVVTSTTNKNLRGPRGGLILAQDAEIGKRLNVAVFPGIQSGPLPEMIAAKAVAFGELAQPAFKEYAEQILANARAIARVLMSRGFTMVTGGTDTPLVIVDLRDRGITGAAAQESLERLNICCNKNLVPGDQASPLVTSGLRLGTSAITTRGFDEPAAEALASVMCDVLDHFGKGDDPSFDATIKRKVEELAQAFPIYPYAVGCLD